MNLRNLFSGLFGRGEPPKSEPSSLRNKPGGTAMIRGLPGRYGSEVLNGRVVITARLGAEGLWEIEPSQTWVVTAPLKDDKGATGNPGDICRTVAIADGCLVPLRDPGEDATDQTLSWLPIPGKVKETA
jgi:hypothetical protein